MERMAISRELYRKIKNMNHREMENYLAGVYTEGFDNGVDSLTKTVASKIIRGLENTKGIGEKRMADIIDNINKEMEAKQTKHKHNFKQED